MIAMAVEHRLQLAPLLREFARDEHGIQQTRIQRLAGLLDEGTSLPDALEQVAHVLPDEEMLAIRIGSQSGSLPKTLQSLVEDKERSEHARLSSQLKGILVYPIVVLLVGTGIVHFLMIKIWPVFDALMRGLGIESTPAAFQTVVDVANVFAHYWWFIVVGTILLLIWIFCMEKSSRIVRRAILRPWFDMRSVDLLQSLSVVAEAGRPIIGAISTLARYHHDPTLRRKLLFVRNEVEHGADTWDALRDAKLLTSAEVALMEVSEKVGNCPWAMSQLAASRRRRIQRRLELLGQLAEPACILMLAAAVFTICVAIFELLASLTMHCT